VFAFLRYYETTPETQDWYQYLEKNNLQFYNKIYLQSNLKEPYQPHPFIKIFTTYINKENNSEKYDYDVTQLTSLIWRFSSNG